MSDARGSLGPDEHQSLRLDIAGYVLGQLTDERRRGVGAHLVGCADCRRDHDELAPAAAALRDVRRPGLPAPVLDAAPPADLGDRIVASVRADRRADRSRTWRAAAVGAVAAAAVLVAGWLVVRPDAVSPVPLEAVAVQSATEDVRADADLVAHTWGVEVKLHASGFTSGERYRVVVLGVDGERYPAGEFVGIGPSEMVCNLSSSVLRDQAEGFEVKDADGRVVVTSEFDA